MVRIKAAVSSPGTESSNLDGAVRRDDDAAVSAPGEAAMTPQSAPFAAAPSDVMCDGPVGASDLSGGDETSAARRPRTPPRERRAGQDPAIPAAAASSPESRLERAPDDAEAWFDLGCAREDLGDRAGARDAFTQACVREPGNMEYSAARGYCEAREDDTWQAGMARLIAAQAAMPASDLIRESVVRACLMNAERGWAEVRASQGKGGHVVHGRRTTPLSSEHDIPPGFYPTTALQVKTAEDCFTRADLLGTADPEVAADIAELGAIVADAKSRHFRATFGEIGISLLCLLGGFMFFGPAPGTGLLGFVCGGGMLMASFQPQYRINRILLSRRGKTMGDSVIGLTAQHEYGGFVYLIMLMMFFPFIAAYKFYNNWGEWWLARSALPAASVYAERAPALSIAPPDHILQAVAFAAPSAVPAPEISGAAAALAAEASPALRKEPVEIPGPRVAQPHGADPESEAQDLPGGDGVPPLVVLAAEADMGQPDNGGAMAAPLPAAIGEFLRRISRRPLLAAVPLVLILLAIGVGSWLSLRSSGQASATTAPASAPGVAAPAPTTHAAAPAPRPVSGSPTLVDTATLNVGGTIVRLSGVIGETGIPMTQMKSFIAEQGGSVTCDPAAGGTYLCRTTQGYDLAAAALVNGAARTSADAITEYRDMQAQAQSNHRGIWK